VVERQFEECLSRYDAAPLTRRGARFSKGLRVLHMSSAHLDDQLDKRQIMRTEEPPNPGARVPRLRDWCLETDPTNELELLEDDWLQQKELWQVQQGWTWAHVYDFLALLTIDVALSNVEQGEPYK